MKVRGGLSDVGNLLSPCGFWECNSDPQAWCQHLHLLSHLTSPSLSLFKLSRSMPGIYSSLFVIRKGCALRVSFYLDLGYLMASAMPLDTKHFQDGCRLGDLAGPRLCVACLPVPGCEPVDFTHATGSLWCGWLRSSSRT